MLRFVSAPGHVITFDGAEKLPGHGFWLKADKDILNQAITKRIFYKAAKGTVNIPDDLADQVLRTLKSRCINLLGLCRKAGLLVYGFEAVKKATTHQSPAAIFEAFDASRREENKLIKGDTSFPVWHVLSREELGQIAGESEIVHIALLDGTLSQQANTIARKIDLLENGSQTKG
ncbi:MAG: DUF448 domain-containing protein [Alphaproteobacteria bacterium]|nr:DUF448 domain-containing protein [Alphaproteobacteria bacterium]